MQSQLVVSNETGRLEPAGPALAAADRLDGQARAQVFEDWATACVGLGVAELNRRSQILFELAQEFDPSSGRFQLVLKLVTY